MNMDLTRTQFAEIKKLHLDFAKKRGLEKTYCPSEVAKAFSPSSWRTYMRSVREVADELVLENDLIVMQKGEIIMKKPSMTEGPFRLRKSDDQ